MNINMMDESLLESQGKLYYHELDKHREVWFVPNLIRLLRHQISLLTGQFTYAKNSYKREMHSSIHNVLC